MIDDNMKAAMAQAVALAGLLKRLKQAGTLNEDIMAQLDSAMVKLALQLNVEAAVMAVSENPDATVAEMHTVLAAQELVDSIPDS